MMAATVMAIIVRKRHLNDHTTPKTNDWQDSPPRKFFFAFIGACYPHGGDCIEVETRRGVKRTVAFLGSAIRPYRVEMADSCDLGEMKWDFFGVADALAIHCRHVAKSVKHRACSPTEIRWDTLAV